MNLKCRNTCLSKYTFFELDVIIKHEINVTPRLHQKSMHRKY